MFAPFRAIFIAPVLLAGMLTAATAHEDLRDSLPAPETEGVTLAWASPQSLKVVTNVALPNGCHVPESIMSGTAENSVPVAHALAVTIRIKVEPGFCTQDYRIHTFRHTLQVDDNSAHGLILYVMRSDQPTTATLHSLPARKFPAISN